MVTFEFELPPVFTTPSDRPRAPRTSGGAVLPADHDDLDLHPFVWYTDGYPAS
jgi:hypothetical protein